METTKEIACLGAKINNVCKIVNLNHKTHKNYRINYIVLITVSLSNHESNAI